MLYANRMGITMDHRQINNLWVNGLLQTFSALGLDMAALCRGIKSIEQGRLAPGQQVDLVEARTLWHRAVAASDFSNLGVEVGLRLSPRSTGLLFPLLLHSPSIRTAVELLVRYQMLISQNGLFRVNDINSSNSLLCTYVPARSSVAVHPQHSLSVITAALKTLGSISSRRIRASLCLPAGLDAEGISALLQCPVQAAGELYILELACEGMDEPIAGRDEHLYQLTLGYAEGLLRAQNAGQGFLDQIKHHMDGEQLVQTDIDTVAAAVGVTRRTLQRHLDDQGTSFRKLKEGLLKERVLELLVARHLPISHIAEALGYADVSTFHRAFKAWFGVTPRQFKSQIGS